MRKFLICLFIVSVSSAFMSVKNINLLVDEDFNSRNRNSNLEEVESVMKQRSKREVDSIDKGKANVVSLTLMVYSLETNIFLAQLELVRAARTHCHPVVA